MPKNIKDIDMVNAHPAILNYVCKKNNVDCSILKNYIENYAASFRKQWKRI